MLIKLNSNINSHWHQIVVPYVSKILKLGSSQKKQIFGERDSKIFIKIFFFEKISVICCKNCCFECSTNIVKKIDKTLGYGCDVCIFGLIFPRNVFIYIKSISD